MSIARERIIGALTVLNDNDIEKIWSYVQSTFSKSSAWDNIPEVEPTEEEIAILTAYENGDPEYQPTIPFSEAMKELGL